MATWSASKLPPSSQLIGRADSLARVLANRMLTGIREAIDRKDFERAAALHQAKRQILTERQMVDLLSPAPARTRRDRRLTSTSRPGARRVRKSSNSSRGDPDDLGDDPPRHPSRCCEDACSRCMRRWAR